MIDKKLTKKYLMKMEKRETNRKFREWSLEIRKRDLFTCVICGSQDMVGAHHIIPREDKRFRFEICNGISLCPLHHKYGREISAHNNPFIFFLWIWKNRKEQFLKLLDLYQKAEKEAKNEK